MTVVKMGSGWNLDLMKIEWEVERCSSPTGEWVCSSIGREWEWECPEDLQLHSANDDDCGWLCLCV